MRQPQSVGLHVEVRPQNGVVGSNLRFDHQLIHILGDLIIRLGQRFH